MWAASFFLRACIHQMWHYHERCGQYRTAGTHPAIHGILYHQMKMKLTEESIRGHMNRTAACWCAKKHSLNPKDMLLSGCSCCNSPAQNLLTFHFLLHRIHPLLHSVLSSEALYSCTQIPSFISSGYLNAENNVRPKFNREWKNPSTLKKM